QDHASVAQLDRVGCFEPLGREFESLRMHQIKKAHLQVGLFYLVFPGQKELLSSTKRMAFWTAPGCPAGVRKPAMPVFESISPDAPNKKGSPSGGPFLFGVSRSKRAPQFVQTHGVLDRPRQPRRGEETC